MGFVMGIVDMVGFKGLLQQHVTFMTGNVQKIGKLVWQYCSGHPPESYAEGREILVIWTMFVAGAASVRNVVHMTRPHTTQHYTTTRHATPTSPPHHATLHHITYGAKCKATTQITRYTTHDNNPHTSTRPT